jgi:hypothetical protein
MSADDSLDSGSDMRVENPILLALFTFFPLHVCHRVIAVPNIPLASTQRSLIRSAS